MASTLSIGTSGLLTAQSGLSTTSHNISNVNTEGYSRQRIEQGTRIPEFNGGFYLGTGVEVTAVERLYDSFLSDQVRLFTSQEQQFSTLTTFSKQVDDLLGSQELSLSAGLDSFFDSVQAVADDPTSIPARQVMLSEAGTLTERFNTIDSQLRSFNQQVNTNLDATVKDINSLTAGIAELNQAIAEADGAPGVPPNDLLDKRDQLVNKLSELVTVSTVEQSNGSLNVFIGTGQPVVVGNSTTELSTFPDPSDTTRLLIGFGPNQVNVTQQLTGGQIGGLISARRDVIDPARNEIDALAAGLINVFNEQHQIGITLDGNAGGNFFQPDDTSPQNAGSISLGISDPRDIAIAFPVSVNTNNTNTGTASLNVEAIDGSAAGFNAVNTLAANVSLSYDDANSRYDISYNGETLTLNYDPATDSGKTFDLSTLGFSSDLPLTVTLTGTPGDGDAFTLANSVNGGSFNGVGDNRNALALGELQISKTLNALDANGNPVAGPPTRSFGDAYGSLVANVATKTKQAEASQETQKSLLDQTTKRFDQVSGVNLDEEAANLIKYQQSYQAAAQIITVSNTVFETLISSF